jgi:all-trans-retinol 13,14-reductase
MQLSIVRAVRVKVDVVIVGSGISGLTAGVLLAKKGRKVAVVEKQADFGGALRQFRRNRIAYDVGFHYTGCLGRGELLDLLWRYCGTRDDIDVIPLSDTGYDQFEFAQLADPVRGYFSYDRFESELLDHFPEEQLGIKKYFSTIRAICSEVPFYNTCLSLTPFLRGYKSRPRSLAAFLDTVTGNHNLRAILAAPAFLYGVPIELASLEIHALVAHGYYSGAYTIGGGGQAIVDAFMAVLGKQGGEMYASTEVNGIRVRDGKVCGVDIRGGQQIECSQVIFTGHPAHIIDFVPPGIFRPAYRTRLRELRNSLSMFAVFGKSSRPVELADGPLNYYLLPDEQEVIPKDSSTPRQFRPMMMTGTSVRQGEILQGTGNGIILLRLGYWEDVAGFEKSSPANRPAAYVDLKEKIAGEMVSAAEERWGSICGAIKPFAVGTPLTFRDELAAPDGCAYGAMHCLDQINPDVRTRLPGLYLSGQSTLMTGVVGASISGLVGAGEILGLESLWEEVRKWRQKGLL